MLLKPLLVDCLLNKETTSPEFRDPALLLLIEVLSEAPLRLPGAFAQRDIQCISHTLAVSRAGFEAVADVAAGKNLRLPD